MHSRLVPLFMLVAIPVALCAASGQQPARPAKPAVQRDTTTKPDTTEADSTADDEGDKPDRTITAGMSFGGLNYTGGRSERATSAVLRWHALPWLSIGATPTFARSSEPDVLLPRQVVAKSGLTDLPIEVGADRSFDLPLSPSLNLGLGITLPLGDTASGFGAGSVGTSISLGGGIALSEKLGLHASVGRSLTDFSLQSSFNGTSPSFGDAGLSLQATDGLSFSGGLDGDLGHPDSTYGRAASVSGGVSFSLPFVNSLSLNASRGIMGATPTWSFALGVGTDFASVGSVGLKSAAARLHRAFGGGTHGLVVKNSKNTPRTRIKH